MSVKMVKMSWLLAPLAAVALGSGCGDDGEKSSAGPSGDGTPITADNAAEVQAAVTTIIGNVAAKGPGTHKGAVSGQVEIELALGKRAQIDIGGLGGLGGTTAVKFSMKFDNYSDDGVNWLDGTVDYSFEAPNLSYAIDLTLSGAYAGEVEGEVSVANGVVSGFWVVDGQRINF